MYLNNEGNSKKSLYGIILNSSSIIQNSGAKFKNDAKGRQRPYIAALAAGAPNKRNALKLLKEMINVE